ncbi:helix-turn-helix transcriptional regulator [Halostella litorea]|uniref:helix-turn-helix transcriptional regulator n=1 Tax=Halostella litorea TaxID=2528831 RepID=UPI001091BAE8|nr:GntR family transcriptional regulator [Halostella litorea]
MGRDDAEVVRTLCDRREFLVALRGKPREKRALVETIGVSRSTVDRAIRELWAEGLVEETDRGYRLTAVGRLAAAFTDGVLAVSRDLRAASDVLAPLPADAPLDLRLLRNAKVAEAEPTTRSESVASVHSVFREADRLYAFAQVVTRSRTLDVLADAVDRGATVEVVFDARLAEELLPRMGDRVAALTARGFRPLSTDGVPFGLLLGETDDGWKTRVVTYDEDGDLRGVVANDRPAAAAWAWDVYRSYRSRAVDLSPAFSG